MIRSLRKAALALGLQAALALGVTAAEAQTPPRATDGVTLPYRSLASTDDASAIFVNPANLAFGPGPEARVTIVYTPDEAPIPLRGYSLDLGIPFWVLATGLRIDWMDPPLGASDPTTGLVGQRYNWIRWANAVRFGDAAAFGTTLAWSNADDNRLHGMFSVTSALTLRPSRFLSLATVARDWNSPKSEGGLETRPSVDLAASFRPVEGRRALELGLEASYRSVDQRWVPSANAGVDIPYVGRLKLGASLLDPSEGQVVVSSAVQVNFDSLQLTGGAVFGNALQTEGTGFVAGAAIRGFREKPRVPGVNTVARLRLESTPGIREHVRLLRVLWKLADDDEVDGLVLVLRSSPAGSLAHAEEVIDAIKLLRKRGKKVLCHLEDATGTSLFVCSAADRIAMNPAGGLRFAGLSTRYLYFGGLLDKLGVRADFVRIGSHKLAPEQFTHGSSNVGKADHQALLAAYEDVYLSELARGRGMSRQEAKKAIAAGPFIAPEARDHRLIDQLVYDDEISRYTDELFGERVILRDLELPTVAPEHWRAPPKIAVIYLHGDMVDGNSQQIPILNIKLAGSYTIAKALKAAREDSSVKAVVFRIETGGGSSLAADVILREAQLTAKAKPLIVSMGGRAASGGYYAAVAGQKILANRATVTGSIGIFYGKVDVVQLLDKLGVRSESLRSAPRADAESLFRPFTDEEHAELGRKVKQFYDLFIGRVAEGRKMTPAEVHAVAQGRVWTGDQARTRGLVDEIGGMRQALAEARKAANLPDDAPILELPAPPKSLLETVLELAGVPSLKTDAAPLGWVPPPLMDVARALAPFVVHEPTRPLARMDLLITEP